MCLSMGMPCHGGVLRRLVRRGDDAGLTLIELMFALVIFAIVAAATVAGLTLALNTGRLDRNRVAAANLAARELEIVRTEFTASPAGPTTLAAQNYVTDPHPLPGGTAGQPIVVDNVAYTVVRNVQWLPTGTGQSACDGGSAITYPTLAVNVKVSWPRMDGVQAVTSNTILTPPKGVLSSSLGFVAIPVVNAAGQPSAGQPVTLTGPGGTLTDTTATDGCAVFSITTPGTYTASITTPGGVDFYGNATSSQSVLASAGTLVKGKPFTYDQASTLNVKFETAGGFALPTSLPQLTLGNTNLQPTGIKTLPSTGTTTALTGLFPFSDGYTVWAGGCQQSDPAAAGGTRTATVVAPGQSKNVDAHLAPVTVQAVQGINPLAGATVVAVPVSDTGCVATTPPAAPNPDNPLTLGVTDATGQLNTSLPAGSWQLEISGMSPAGGSWPTTPTLLPNSAPSSVTVVTS
jgi:prepilin-type N-terminal cleavage/methylation domain-containing protein